MLISSEEWTTLESDFWGSFVTLFLCWRISSEPDPQANGDLVNSPDRQQMSHEVIWKSCWSLQGWDDPLWAPLRVFVASSKTDLASCWWCVCDCILSEPNFYDLWGDARTCNFEHMAVTEHEQGLALWHQRLATLGLLEDHLLWGLSIWPDKISVDAEDRTSSDPWKQSSMTWAAWVPRWSARPIRSALTWPYDSLRSLSTVPWLWCVYGGLTWVGRDISGRTCSWMKFEKTSLPPIIVILNYWRRESIECYELLEFALEQWLLLTLKWWSPRRSEFSDLRTLSWPCRMSGQAG